MRNLLLISGATIGIIVECAVLAALLVALLIVSVKLLRSKPGEQRAPEAVPQEQPQPQPVLAAEPATEPPAAEPAASPEAAAPEATAPEATAPAAEPAAEPEVSPAHSARPAAVTTPFVASLTPEQEELYRSLKPDKSFTAKLIQAEEETKTWYSELKNALLSYKGVRARMSWRRETYRKGRTVLARFGVRGKTLCLYLALRPEDFAESKYKVESASGHRSFADTPLMYRIKNALRMRYAKELIGILMEQNGLEYVEAEPIDLTEELAYRSTPQLIEEGLIHMPAEEALSAPAAEPAPAEENVAEPVSEEEIAEENENAEVPETENAEENEAAEEPAPVEEITEEPASEEVPQEETPEEEIAAAEEPAEEPVSEEETAEEVAGEAVSEEQPAEEAEEEIAVEELSDDEKVDVESYSETPQEDDEEGIPVVGVMFRHRGRKVYWFDPDGKEWKKGEIALYKSPDNPPQEVIVVDVTKRALSKLHLPLQALYKVGRRQ